MKAVPSLSSFFGPWSDRINRNRNNPCSTFDTININKTSHGSNDILWAVPTWNCSSSHSPLLDVIRMLTHLATFKARTIHSNLNLIFLKNILFKKILTWNRCPLQNKFPTKRNKIKKMKSAGVGGVPAVRGPPGGSSLKLATGWWTLSFSDGDVPNGGSMGPGPTRGWRLDAHPPIAHVFPLLVSICQEGNEFFSVFSFCVHWRGEHSVINTSCNVLERSKWGNYHTGDHYGTLSRAPLPIPDTL